MMKVLRFLLPIVVLAAGVAVLVGLVKTKPKPKKKDVVHLGTLVEVMTAKAKRHTIDVHAHGNVRAEHTQVISPEVGGRIIWLNKEVDGLRRFSAGEQVARIDGRDLYLAIQQQRAQVDSARTNLQIEEGRRKIAEREWKIMGGKQLPADSLALRDPQLRTARVQVKAARSGLQRSQLAASKTLLRSPFNAIVIDKHASLGQLVMPGTPLLTVAATDRYLVTVSVPLRRLGYIKVPGINGVKQDGGSHAEVRQDVGERVVVRTGKVIRLEGTLDPKGRMAKLVVAVDDPLQLKTPVAASSVESRAEKRSHLPLIIGAFVKVKISGETLDNAIELPRLALRDGNKVFVKTAQNTLDIRTVDIGWRLEEAVLVTGGLRGGEQVITSPVPVPLEGMKLRLPEGTSAAEAKASVAPSGSKSTRNDRGSSPIKPRAAVSKP